jgi:hypothetical protein
VEAAVTAIRMAAIKTELTKPGSRIGYWKTNHSHQFPSKHPTISYPWKHSLSSDYK